MSEWFYVEGDERKGPVDLAQLQALADRRVVMPGTLVWKKGLSDWTAASEVRDLRFNSEPPPIPHSRKGKDESTDLESAAPMAPGVPKPPIVRKSRLLQEQNAAPPASKRGRGFFDVRPGQLLLLGVVVIAAVGFLLSMHVVSSSSGTTLVAKRSLTFSNTFVDLDELIQRWNDRSLRQVLRGDPDLEALVDELERRGLIHNRHSAVGDASSDSAPGPRPARAAAAPSTAEQGSVIPVQLPAEQPKPLPTSSPSSQPLSSAGVVIGQPFAAKDCAITIRSIERVKQLRLTTVGNTDRAGDGMTFVVVVWSLMNTTRMPLGITGYLCTGATFVDRSGMEYALDFRSGLYGLDRQGWRNFTGPINPGQTIDQCAIFVVPDSGTDGAHIVLGTEVFGPPISIGLPPR